MQNIKARKKKMPYAIVIGLTGKLYAKVVVSSFG